MTHLGDSSARSIVAVCWTCASYKPHWPLSPSGLSLGLVNILTPVPLRAGHVENHKRANHDIREVSND